MLRFAHDAAMADRRRKAQRDRIEGPILYQRLDLGHHFARGHVRTRFEFSTLRARNHHLYIRAANVDDEDSFLHCVSDFGAPVARLSSTTAIGTSRSARTFFAEPLSFFTRSRET